MFESLDFYIWVSFIFSICYIDCLVIGFFFAVSELAFPFLEFVVLWVILDWCPQEARFYFEVVGVDFVEFLIVRSVRNGKPFEQKTS